MDDYGPPRIASKLVRDNIPGNRRAESGEHYTLLIAKLHEETEEVARAKTTDEVVEELGDVIDVCKAIAAKLDIAWWELSNRRAVKASAKGGFSQGIVQDSPMWS